MAIFNLLVAGLALAETASAAATKLKSRASDPEDFSWIKKWAAVGDSFTAGIGSGVLYSDLSTDRDCSRYDYSYPALMNRFFGPSVDKFTYTACSGATSVDIAAQIDALNDDLDLVVLTAGGNDLCLTSIIMSCILNSVTSESACTSKITQAQNAIDSILQSNIEELLTALDAKMADNGIIVLASYGEYFNTETDECTNHQDWVFPGQAGSTSLLLTQDRRTKFNTLVVNTNNKLQAAVDAVSDSAKSSIVFSNWDSWTTATNGQFCEPGSSADPDDSSNADVLFYKLATSKVYNPGTLYKRDEKISFQNYGNMTDVEDELAEADILRAALNLAEREVSGPACGKGLLSGLLPDSIGKIFHPNNLGHEAITSFVTASIIDARADILGVTSPFCDTTDELTCSQKDGSKAYASSYSLYSNSAAFCSATADQVPENTYGWSFSKTYNSGTPDEVSFSISLTNDAKTFNEDDCNTAVNHILDDCDGNDPNNPMDWKFGGTYVDGSYTYKISPKRINRPWPVPTEPTGYCKSSYKFLWDSYTMKGAGWASWDSGQKTLRPNSTSCFGLGLTKWDFEYFDSPDDDGYEWQVTFRSPIWTRARCYNNNKVQKAAGGPTSGGCSGNG